MADQQKTDTRERVLDAAMEIVAERGLQALTHRGVEERAQVSHGITTYYFKNRSALIDALFVHIAERQIAWITAMHLEMAAEFNEDPDLVGREAFARRAIERMQAERTLTLARYEMYLHSARDPRLQELTTRLRRRHVEIQAEMLAAAGAANPDMAANRMLSAIEGMLLYQLSVPEADFERWAAAYLLLVIEALVDFDPQP